jgi:hypothetical protein
MMKDHDLLNRRKTESSAVSWFSAGDDSNRKKPKTPPKDRAMKLSDHMIQEHNRRQRHRLWGRDGDLEVATSILRRGVSCEQRKSFPTGRLVASRSLSPSATEDHEKNQARDWWAARVALEGHASRMRSALLADVKADAD